MTSAGRIKTAFRWMVALTCVAPVARAADAVEAVEEYRLKAAFVSKFASFVEWPPEAWKSPFDPLVICVVGENPFGSALDQAVSGNAVQDHKLAVRHVASAKQTAGCQIVFISSSERKRLRSILKEIPPTGILTVGDADNFAAEGGIIDLPVEGDKVRIIVNIDAAEQARLRISSKLLGLARIVRK